MIRLSFSSKLIGSLMTITTAFNHPLVTSAVTGSTTKTPTVRLHSIHSPIIQQQNPNINNNERLKIVHFIRHAQGYHNIHKDYKSPAHFDAELTELGIQQCRDLSKIIQEKNLDVECIICSPMRRALQTAHYSFAHILDNDNGDGTSTIPFVACENWRETLNYICDARYPLTHLKEHFPHVDFTNIQHEHDPIRQYYDEIYGSFEEHTAHRESDDDDALERRTRQAWGTIEKRPERNMALVGHSAFFWHVFGRDPQELGVVEYGDRDVEALMMERGFENCELRSVAVEFL